MLPQRAIESLRDYITSRDGFTVIAHISPDGMPWVPPWPCWGCSGDWGSGRRRFAPTGRLPYMGFCPWQISCAPQSRRWGIPM